MSASSSTTSGWRRVRTPGIPSKCWCGVGITELISQTNQNQYRRYYRCIYAASLRLENDNHVFKWVDEAFTDEIQKVRMLEEEPKIKISGGCVILALVLVLGIMMYKK
ncbi:BnaC08g04230D [Brassica napus]|uniref:BnaC08g04230D protein n=1 Tax=Brassica napus TaxID=3708 RepID=A0A078FXB4_BRANA|nr:BnaC08g04230D [Brassica napus]